MRPGADPATTRWVSIRLGIIAVLFAGGFALVAWKAVQLQVVQRDVLSAEARNQYVRQIVMAPRRGAIVDRSGVILAASADAESVFVDPKELEDKTDPGSRPLAQLARALSLDPRALRAKVERGQPRFVWVKRRVSAGEAAAVRRLELPGVQLVAESRRYYPRTTLAGQLLGITGEDGTGLEGVELSLDDVLRGEPGRVPSLRDGRGRVALEGAVGTNRQREGARVELTIDQGLQLVAERSLAEAVRSSRALSGMVVALDPYTGEVLAMASWPPVNPNAPARAQELRNRPVTDAFEPGSTIKTFTIAGALDKGALRPGDAIDCSAGYTVGGHQIHDHRSLGWIGPAKVLAVSSNVGAARIGARLGKQGLNEALAAFGFGQRSGIDLPGERKGALPFPRADIALATQSFGQGLTATALQVVLAMGAIANGGTLMEPMLVRRIIDPGDGGLIDEAQPTAVRRAVSAETARTLARWLTGVVEDPEGTGKRARPEGWRVAGKTGTAQKADPVSGGYSAERNFSSFVGFAPAESPRVVIGVFIDEPKGETFGGEVAAPPFREIASYALKMVGVPVDLAGGAQKAPPVPQNASAAPRPVAGQSPAPPPLAPGQPHPAAPATNLAGGAQKAPPVPQNASAAPRPVAGQSPAPPPLAPGQPHPAAPALADLAGEARMAPEADDEPEPQATAALAIASRRAGGSTGGVAVPSLSGLPARAAIRTLEALDLAPEVVGTGKVATQSPPAGRVVERGARVRLTLAPAG